MSSPRRFYEFGSFSIDLHSRILLREGRIVPLTPKAFETLLVLVEHRGDVVSRRELIDAVWPDTHVVEGTLNSNIFSLRRVLGESDDIECFISTVPRRGYRFVAGVREVTSPADLQSPGASTLSSRHSVPWSVSTVATRESISSYGDSGTTSSDSQATVERTLSNGNPGTSLAESIATGERISSNDDFGSGAADSFPNGEPESNGNAVLPSSTGYRSSGNGRRADADRAYLQGHYLLSRRTSRALHQAIECFSEATRLDPEHAAAQVGLAQCYSLLGCVHSATRPREAMPRAKSAALRALELDASSADAHAALGLVQTLYDWDWAGGERSYLRALHLNPDHVNARHWYGLHLAWRGRQAEAETELARARQLDPFSPIIAGNVGWAHYAARRYNEAIDQLTRTIAISPTFYRAHVYLGWAYTQTANFALAFEHLQRGIELNGGGPEVAGLGYAYARAGLETEASSASAMELTMRARLLVTELEERAQREYVSPYSIASVYAGLGETDRALSWLERAYDDRTHWLVFLRVEPMFDSVRGDGRFEKLLSLIDQPDLAALPVYA